MKKKIVAKKPMSDIENWARLYTESLTEDELKESVDEKELLNTAFSTLLCFMSGEGDKVLKDTEWMMYLMNDIGTAIQQKLFIPTAEDKQKLRRLQAVDDDIDA